MERKLSSTPRSKGPNWFFSILIAFVSSALSAALASCRVGHAESTTSSFDAQMTEAMVYAQTYNPQTQSLAEEVVNRHQSL